MTVELSMNQKSNEWQGKLASMRNKIVTKQIPLEYEKVTMPILFIGRYKK